MSEAPPHAPAPAVSGGAALLGFAVTCRIQGRGGGRRVWSGGTLNQKSLAAEGRQSEWKSLQVGRAARAQTPAHPPS